MTRLTTRKHYRPNYDSEEDLEPVRRREMGSVRGGQDPGARLPQDPNRRADLLPVRPMAQDLIMIIGRGRGRSWVHLSRYETGSR